MAVYDLRTPIALPEWAPVPPLRTVSRGGVRLEPGTHKPHKPPMHRV